MRKWLAIRPILAIRFPFLAWQYNSTFRRPWNPRVRSWCDVNTHLLLNLAPNLGVAKILDMLGKFETAITTETCVSLAQEDKPAQRELTMEGWLPPKLAFLAGVDIKSHGNNWGTILGKGCLVTARLLIQRYGECNTKVEANYLIPTWWSWFGTQYQRYVLIAESEY